MLSPWEPVRFSRCAEKRVVRPSADPEGALLDLLLTLDKPGRPVLIPASDFLAHFIARHLEPLSRRFACAVPSVEIFDTVFDKARDTARLSQAGFPVPRTPRAAPRAGRRADPAARSPGHREAADLP